MKKIVLSGGGTFGHIWPTLSIWEKLKNETEGLETLYLDSRDGKVLELLKDKDIQYKKIYSGKWRRYFSFENLIDPFKVIIGFFQSLAILIRFKPDIVFAKGGYVTVPVGIAAWVLRIPLCIHESDSLMGVSNKFLSYFSKKIFVSFPTSYYIPRIAPKAVYTGIPIREDLGKVERKMAIANFDFSTGLPIILIMGGSQGAQGINNLIFSKLENYLEKFQVIHLCGKLDFNRAQKLARKIPQDLVHRYRYFDFIVEEIGDAYAAADLVVSRAGATTLAELSSLRKPAILIPYISAAGDHQSANAKIFQDAQAAIVMNEAELKPEKLFAQITDLIQKKDKRRQLSENINRFHQRDAAARIVYQLLQNARTK